VTAERELRARPKVPVFRTKLVSRINAVSRLKTRDRTFPRRTLTLASSAMAVAAVSAGAVAAGPIGASPIGPGPTGVSPVSSTPVAGGSAPIIVLDAFTRPLRAAGAGAVRPARRLTARQIAWFMLKSYGWTTREYPSLSSLWARESGWNPYARNSYSGAYGIPQAMPGGKMASAGGDWRTNPRTQIRWGLHYIKVVYGSPSRAWRHELSYGWY
jgi:hypothetical protein